MFIADNVSVAFGEKQVLKGVNFEAERGSIIGILGPNGIGKTTLLKVTAGLLNPNSGKLSIDGRSPNDTRRGYVPQNYAGSLLPWKTIGENISLPSEFAQNKDSSLDARRFVERVLGLTQFNLPLEAYPYQVSGGQQQMAAVLRSFINNPDIVLLDEPFSSLDILFRESISEAFQLIWSELDAFGFLVTHEIETAMQLADKIIVLGGSPASVISEIKIDFDKPRSSKIIFSPSFIKIREEIREHITRS